MDIVQADFLLYLYTGCVLMAFMAALDPPNGMEWTIVFICVPIWPLALYWFCKTFAEHIKGRS